jgi:hypothetical protein
LKEIGMGNAEARKAGLLAEADGRAALAEVAETPEGKFLAALETFGQSFGGGKLVVTPQDNLMGIVASLNQLTKLAEEAKISPHASQQHTGHSREETKTAERKERPAKKNFLNGMRDDSNEKGGSV